MPKFIKKFRIDQIEGLLVIMVVTSVITFGVLEYVEMRLLDHQNQAQNQSIEHAQRDNATVQASNHSRVDMESGEVEIQ